MVPVKKVEELILRHKNLEAELSSGNIDPKLYAKKSKAYSNLGNIISVARDYVKFDNEKKDLEQIVKDRDNDSEIIELAEKDLNTLRIKKEDYENRLKIFLLPSLARHLRKKSMQSLQSRQILLILKLHRQNMTQKDLEKRQKKQCHL